MIAEIYHKISSTGSNLSERLEDELTGNYFGNLRYIPFYRGIGKILATYAQDDGGQLKSIFSQVQTEEWNTEFWKKSDLGYGEIDCYMNQIENISLGIEVKYHSDLSTDNQLEREANMLHEWGGKDTKVLLFVAPRKDYCQSIYNVNKAKEAMTGIHFGYLTWEDALLGLDKVETENSFEELIVNDIKDLLIGKGFAGFHGFLIPKELREIDENVNWEFNGEKFRNKIFGFCFPQPRIEGDSYEFR